MADRMEAPESSWNILLRITEAMEPKPAPVSARELRDGYRDLFKGANWVTTHPHPSPGGWWEAEIGTDHGPETDDDKPVRWRPSRDPLADIADAWLVVEKMRERGLYIDLRASSSGYFAMWSRAGRDDEDIWVTGSSHVADDAPLAICLAALKALENTHSDTPPTEGQPT